VCGEVVVGVILSSRVLVMVVVRVRMGFDMFVRFVLFGLFCYGFR